MNRDELIELVDKIMRAEGTEAEVDGWITQLRNSVVAPSVTDYIYWEDLTAEQVVDKALSYKPIIL